MGAAIDGIWAAALRLCMAVPGHLSGLGWWAARRGRVTGRWPGKATAYLLKVVGSTHAPQVGHMKLAWEGHCGCARVT